MKFYKISVFIFLIFILSLGAVCAQDLNQSIDNSNDLEVSDSEILSESPDNSFDALNTLINSTTENEINIENDYIFNMQSDSNYVKGIKISKCNLTINGNNHIIDSSGQSRFFQFLESNITINNLIFKNGNNSGIAVYQGQLKTNNVTFNNCSSDYGSTVYIELGSYYSSNDKFINNYASEAGSSIYATHAKVHIDSADFANDRQINWGLIYVEDKSELEISNTVFKDLTSRYATAIYSENIERIYVKKSKFINLYANATAGAIGLKGVSNAQIDDCEFINVTSLRNGGGIFADINALSETSSGDVSISNSIFTNCSSEFGGAILQLGGYLYIYDSNFTDNFADFDGAAIYCSNVTSGIYNSTFKENLAGETSISDYNGGAIYFDNGELDVKTSQFINNSISDIFLYDSQYIIQNNDFKSSNLSVVSYFDRKGSYQKNNGLNTSEISLNNTYYETIISENGVILNLTGMKLNADITDEYFNLADLGLASAVKNQGTMNSCWAFGAASALESAFLRQANFTADISENNIKSVGLRYSIYGIESTVERANEYTSIGYYTSWLGVVPKQYDTYDELGKISPLIYTEDNYHVQNIMLIDLNKGNDEVKQALIDYGELVVSMSSASIDNEKFFNEETSALYVNDKNINSDHIVTIVGWNDTFSKDNFKITPPGDGAWIVKNSWGEKWGDNGYLYISYYDLPMKKTYLNGYILSNNNPYTTIYQYDLIGTVEYINLKTAGSYFNIFTAEDNELISAVGTYFNNKEKGYTVNIIVNDEIIYTQSGKSSFAGYETIKLDKQISINKGENFTVQMISDTVPIIEDVRPHYKNNVSSAIINNTLYSLSEFGQIACLKAYTVKNPINTTNLVNYYSNDLVYSFNVNKSNEIVEVEFNGKKTNCTSDENGTVTINLGKLDVGNYPLTINYANHTIVTQILVKPTIDVGGSYKITIGYNTKLDFGALFLDADGNPIKNTEVTAKFDGKSISNAKTNKNGILTITVEKGNSKGTHTLYFYNPETGEKANINIKIVSRFSNTANVNMYYFDGSKFTAKIIGNDGEAVGKNAVVTIKINKITYKVKTNSNGKISFKIPKAVTPGKYKLAITYAGETLKKTVKVKQNLKSKKTVTVKKSAKKLVLKATLKNGKTAVSSKKISFKINGKKYAAKTSKKGVAKVTIKSNMIKKLKRGKKYTVKISYLKNTIKSTVKVK